MSEFEYGEFEYGDGEFKYGEPYPVQSVIATKNCCTYAA
jgi:hypothetical protein